MQINHVATPPKQITTIDNRTNNRGYECDVVVGGVYCGKEIGDVLLAEEITERRFVIRQRIEPTYARRLGEVCGGEQYGGGLCYQATRPDGAHVATQKSFESAVKTLIQA
jgi:hypothetical protein